MLAKRWWWEISTRGLNKAPSISYATLEAFRPLITTPALDSNPSISHLGDATAAEPPMARCLKKTK
jgi:hypothetical protein